MSPRFDPQPHVATGLLVATAAIYAVANTDLLWAYPQLYYAKHLAVGAAALCALLWRTTFTGATRNLLILAAIYLLVMLAATRDWAAALQAGTFFLACALFAVALRRPHRSFAIVLLAVLVLLPLLRNVSIYGTEYLSTTYFGRERLLLGFFHPKEQANAVVVSALACYLVLQHAPLRMLTMAGFAVVLYFVQSRNGLLFFATFLLANHLYARLSLNTVTVVAFAALLGLIVVLATYDFELYDELASGRLTLWQSALDFPQDLSAQERGASGIAVVNTDNFYLETYLRGGGLALFALLTFLFFVALLSHGRSLHGMHALPLVFALCINALFDSGMTSTGNILHLFTWSAIIACWTAETRPGAGSARGPAMVAR